MARIETWFDQDLKKPVQVHKLEGIFNEDSQGNVIGVNLFDDGVALNSIAGSVTGYFLLADGTTTSAAGTKSGNKASVVVPPAAYKVPGPITITVRILNSSDITTVCACVGLVILSKTPVATPAGSTVADWSAQISAALQNCEDVVAQSVKYGSAQSLTDAQKAQARTNIGAVSQAELQLEATNRENADNELKSAISDVAANVSKKSYKVIATKGASANTSGPLLPFYATSGDSIIAESADGTTFANVQVRFYDANKDYIAYWTLSSGYGNKRTFTYNEVNDAYYVGITTITTSSPNNYIVVNSTNCNNEHVPEIKREAEQMYYQTLITKGDGVIPLVVRVGDTITAESADGKTFADDQLRFYDSDGTYLDYWSLRPTDGKKRTFTYNLAKDAFYISITQVSGNNNKYLVMNESNIYYRDKNIDERSILKYLAENKNDINSVKKNSGANLLFFSDIHKGEIDMARIIEFSKEIGDLSAVINGGDTVASFLSESVSWYDTLVNTSSIPVLNCIGNHDMWTDYWVDGDKKDVYDKFIAPVKTNVPAIVQPSGASTNGLNYYYYDIDSLRIIVLAAMVTENSQMYWDTTQKEWLIDVLDDAADNDMAVICVNHAPYAKADAIIDYDSPLNSWMVFNSDTFDAIRLSPEAITAVGNFISGGGDFVCWLTGHTHNDYIMTETAAPGQFMISIASAKFSNHSDGFSPAAAATDERNFDCFDVIGVDMTNKILKVLRIGYNEDAALKIRNRFSYDYGNAELLANS